MVTRARDIERLRQFNRLVSFTDAAAGGKSITRTWRAANRLADNEATIAIVSGATGEYSHLENIEDVSAEYQLVVGTPGEFFQALQGGDELTITLPAGTITARLMFDGSGRFSEAITSDTGAISNGDSVEIISGAARKNFTTWCRVDDSTISDLRQYNQTDPRRVLFIRTRANPAITTDHKAIIDGLEYETNNIQELANRGELRIALTRTPDPVELGGKKR